MTNLIPAVTGEVIPRLRGEAYGFGTSFPDDPFVGQLWGLANDTAQNAFIYIYNGTSWIPLDPGGPWSYFADNPLIHPLASTASTSGADLRALAIPIPSVSADHGIEVFLQASVNAAHAGYLGIKTSSGSIAVWNNPTAAQAILVVPASGRAFGRVYIPSSSRQVAGSVLGYCIEQNVAGGHAVARPVGTNALMVAPAAAIQTVTITGAVANAAATLTLEVAEVRAIREASQ